MTTHVPVNNTPNNDSTIAELSNAQKNDNNSATQKAIIEVDSLSFSIKNNAILKNLNFTVGSGEVYALLGGNGAGKSTTLKTLLRFNKPTQGSAKVAGK